LPSRRSPRRWSDETERMPSASRPMPC
jgi:hypothetical protein